MRSQPFLALTTLLFSITISATRVIQESPECAKTCDKKLELSEIPLCAINPIAEGQTASEIDIKNMFSCLCTDKKILEKNVPCILQECANDSKSLETWFNQTYTECHNFGGILYPSPPEFLKALNIAVPKNATIPTTIIGVPQGTVFPSPVATTLPLGAIPTEYLRNRFDIPATEKGVAAKSSVTSHEESSGATEVGVSGLVMAVVFLVVLL